MRYGLKFCLVVATVLNFQIVNAALDGGNGVEREPKIIWDGLGVEIPESLKSQIERQMMLDCPGLAASLGQERHLVASSYRLLDEEPQIAEGTDSDSEAGEGEVIINFRIADQRLNASESEFQVRVAISLRRDNLSDGPRIFTDPNATGTVKIKEWIGLKDCRNEAFIKRIIR